ncbi:hypothetical protein [Psychrobacillus sp. FSL K6-1464]|uniref:hypothetical protein n=1 Tax=Psychrobacillus sp. FSL K6-1464 TaxID=2921545 RepID=UPI0030F786E4
MKKAKHPLVIAVAAVSGGGKTILLDMNSYISQGRQGYLEMLNTIKPNSDIIVDGTLSISEIVSIISQSIILNVYE